MTLQKEGGGNGRVEMDVAVAVVVVVVVVVVGDVHVHVQVGDRGKRRRRGSTATLDSFQDQKARLCFAAAAFKGSFWHYSHGGVAVGSHAGKHERMSANMSALCTIGLQNNGRQ